MLGRWFSKFHHLSRSYPNRLKPSNITNNTSSTTNSTSYNHSYHSYHNFQNYYNYYSNRFKSAFRNITSNPNQYLYFSFVPISGFTIGSILVDPISVRADFYQNPPFNNNNNNNNNSKNNNNYHHKNRRFQRRHARQQFGQDLCKAVHSSDYDKVTKLLNQPNADPDARSPHGWAAIHIAVVNNDIKMVKLLIDRGADVNLPDMTSPYVGSVRATEFSDKIHINAPTQGWTSLHYAVAFFNEEMIKLLILNGGNPNIVDSRKYSPTDYIDESIPNGIKIIDLVDNIYETYLDTKEIREREQRLQYPIEDQLKEFIVGQKMPIMSVSSAIRRKLNGWHDPDHPLVFLFLGSSGVGKTELAKSLAKIMCRLDGNNSDKNNGMDSGANVGNNNIPNGFGGIMNGMPGMNNNNNHNNSNKNDLKKKFIRIDMSEFQQKHEVSKFIGSPPGYVGHEQGGQLTSRLKECPDAIVLLDEVEKAHPDVLTIMLQLFDEGRITDGKGQTVECKDAVFIMTSNLAQTEIGDEAETLRRDAQRQDNNNKIDISNIDSNENKNNTNDNENDSGDSTDDNNNNNNNKVVESGIILDDTISLSRAFIEDTVQPILKKHFQRDEFLGRINEILYFLPFNENELKQLTEKELLKWKDAAKDRHDIDLVWDSNAIDLLRDGYNFRYGARSIQHEVEKRVINQLAKIHERGIIKPGMCVNVTADLDLGLINLEYYKDINEAIKNGVNIDKNSNDNNENDSSKNGWFWNY